MIENSMRGFAEIDTSGDPNFFIRFLDARNAIPEDIAIKLRILERLEPVKGKTILDLGCGPGGDTREIARLVGSSGHVTGIDHSEFMITEAMRRNDSTLPIDFRAGNAMHLDFPDSSFDRVRAERVLMHLSDPELALNEMVRVLRAGGRIVVSELDIGTQFIDSCHVELTQRILSSRAAANPTACIGHSLPRLFRNLGLKAVEVETAVTHPPTPMVLALLADHVNHCVHQGLVPQDDAVRWWTDLENAQAAGEYYSGAIVFTVTGTKG